MGPDSPYVFPSTAMPRSTKKRTDEPISVEYAAKMARDSLRLAGVNRPKILEKSKYWLQFRDPDLRTTFVTLSRAIGRSEEWVMLRTGHSRSESTKYM